MEHIYDVTITSDGPDDFTVIWENRIISLERTFRLPQKRVSEFLDYLKDVPGDLWLYSRENALEIGERLCYLLDGPNRYLCKALDEAEEYNKTPLINLHTCTHCKDWPFELLARNKTFLLPGALHLVRQVYPKRKKLSISPKKRKLKLLFISCAPKDYTPLLDFHREEERIAREINRLPIDIDIEDSGTLAGLREKMEFKQYDVVHLSGHAGIDEKNEPFFVMEDECGKSCFVSPGELWKNALKKNPPGLLFLSGCHTGGTAQDRISRCIAHRMAEEFNLPAVLGWGHKVGDINAGHAEAVFYRALSLGNSILDALQMTRSELMDIDDEVNQDEGEPSVNWSQLRLFSDGTTLGAFVKREQGLQPGSEVDSILAMNELPVVKDGFAGRRRELQQVIDVLENSEKYVGVMLLGATGVGKTSLATKVSKHLKDSRLIVIKGILDGVSLYKALDAAFRGDLKTSKLIVPGSDMSKIFARLCKSALRDKQFLLLLENFHENLEGWEKGTPNHMSAEADKILKVLLECLPLTGGMSRLIIASRYGFSLGSENHDLMEKRLKSIHLTGFDGTEQQKLSSKLAEKNGFTVNSFFSELMAEGKGNPGLMEKIAAMLKDNKKAGNEQLKKNAGELQADYVRNSRLVELASGNGDQLKHFLSWLSIFRRPVMGKELMHLAQIAGFGEWEALLKKGLELGLIEYFQEEETYRLIPVLREFLLPESQQIIPFHQVAYQYYLSLLAQRVFDSTEELIHHALGCNRHENVSLYGVILVKYYRDNLLQLNEAREKGFWVISELEKRHVLSTERDSLLINEIALTLKRLSRLNLAVEYFKKSYDINLQRDGGTDEVIAKNLNNLGDTWSDLGNHRKAAAQFRKALTITRNAYGRNSIETAAALNNLGAAIRERGDAEKSIGYFEKAQKILESKLTPDSPEYAETLNNLGTTWEDLKNFEKTDEYYRRAYKIFSKLYSEPHPFLAACFNNQGSLMASRGEYDKALPYYRKGLRMFKECYGLFHLDVAFTYSNLGDSLYHLEKKDSAEECYQKSVNIFRLAAPEHYHRWELEKRLKEAAELKSKKN